MQKFKLIISLLLFSYNLIAFAVPAQVIIIRHGEKPLHGNDLDPKGYQRAAALSPYFYFTKDLLRYGHPVAIYAQKPIPSDPSWRPIQTCTPTARTLHLTIKDKYSHLQYPQLVKEILNDRAYNGKTVLICWEHHMIPNMANSFGVKKKFKPWPGTVFDRTWVITFNKNGKVSSFQNLPQRLLFGDSPK